MVENRIKMVVTYISLLQEENKVADYCSRLPKFNISWMIYTSAIVSDPGVILATPGRVSQGTHPVTVTDGTDYPAKL